MKTVKQMPITGQFVVVWTFDDKIWSDTYKWIGDSLFRYVITVENGEWNEKWEPGRLESEAWYTEEDFKAIFYVNG